MIALIFISFAAIFKALADTLAHHFFSSVFRSWQHSPFWNPLHDRNDAVKRIFNYPIDAWHIANSMMIICFVLAAVFNSLKWHWGLQVVIMGLLFNLVFNTFYNKIFR